jgi:hypothetical protein
MDRMAMTGHPGNTAMRLQHPLLRAGAIVLLWLVGCGGVWAEPSPALDRVSIWLGAHRGQLEAQAGLSGFDERFETDRFSLSERRRTMPRARLDLLLGDRHGLTLDYYELRTGRTEGVSQPFSFDGTRYVASASVSADIEMDVATAAYRWWLGRGATVLGMGAGLAAYRLDLGITGRAALNGSAIEARAEHASTEVAPLLGIGVRHRLSDRVRLYADASGIRDRSGRSTGHIYNAAAGAEWFPWTNVGLGVEHGVKRVKFTRQGSDVQGDLNLKLDKPSLFLRVRF